jgi:hypothetical protein
MMDNLFLELEEVTQQQFVHGELPEWLAQPIFRLIQTPANCAGKEYLLELLIMQVKEYDVYAEAGCCKWAYDHEDIARTLRWLEE